jgi:hypothetical protein
LVSANAADANGAERVGAKPMAPVTTPVVLRKSRRVMDSIAVLLFARLNDEMMRERLVQDQVTQGNGFHFLYSLMSIGGAESV